MKILNLIFLIFISCSTYAQFSSQEQKEFISRHNFYRHQVGITNNLVWSDKLAEYAQKWAEHIAKKNKLEHSSNKYGENIFWCIGYVPTPTEVVDTWAKEKKYYHGEAISNTNYHLFGHYTQIIWAKTQKVGCGIAKAKNGGYYIVCEYEPAGNYISEKPY